MTTGQWLAQARDQAGMSYEQAAYQLRDELPRPMWVSLGTIRRMEMKADEEQNPLVVLALARVYGVSESDLPPTVKAQIGQIRALVEAGAGGALTQAIGGYFNSASLAATTGAAA